MAPPFITIISLRGKDETSPKVKQYFTCLGTHGKQLQAIRVDHGKEFLNDYSTSHMYHLAFARSYSVKKEKSDLVGCSQLEVEIGSSGVEMTIK